jgi:hypothetical protein
MAEYVFGPKLNNMLIKGTLESCQSRAASHVKDCQMLCRNFAGMLLHPRLRTG